MEHLIKAFSSQEAKCDAGLLQGDALLVCLLGSLSGVLITDIGVESRNQHQGVVEVAVHLLLVGNDADGTVVVKGHDCLSQQSGGLQEIVDADRHKHVQLKVALGGSHANSHVVAHNLNGYHSDSLTLGGVDLTGHDRGAGLVLGNENLAKAKTGAGRQPADVVCNLHHIAGKRLDCAVCEDELVLRSQCMELVARGTELLTGNLGNSLGNLDVKALGGVQTRADCGAAKRKLLKGGQRCSKKLLVTLKAGAPARNLLRKGNGRCVLQVGTAALHNALILLFKTLEGVDKQVDCGEELILNRANRRDMHRSGEGIVRGLAHIDIIVGVAEALTCKLICTVCDNLICVHVGLCAGACLPDNQREVVVECTRHHLVAGERDYLKLFGSHLLGLQRGVCHCRCLFENAKGTRDFARHNLNADTDAEVFMTTLGLCRPVFVGRYSDLTHGVMFNAVFHVFPPEILEYNAIAPRRARDVAANYHYILYHTVFSSSSSTMLKN